MNQYSREQQDLAKSLIEQFGGDIHAAQKALMNQSAQQAGVTPTLNKKPKPSNLGDVIISVSNLTKKYTLGREHVSAVNNVSLSIRSGEFVAVTGTSGSGKSTLLHLLGGLDKPTTGNIELVGHKLAGMNDKQLSIFRNKTIGFVFQFFYLQPFLTLKQNIEVPAIFARQKGTTRAKRSAMLAETVGLADRLNHLPRELSGGQMQRAAIARALQNRPRILFADEPTGNLDRKNALAIFELFEKIRQEHGTTIVVVTHDQELASKADRALSMQDGVIIGGQNMAEPHEPHRTAKSSVGKTQGRIS